MTAIRLLFAIIPVLSITFYFESRVAMRKSNIFEETESNNNREQDQYSDRVRRDRREKYTGPEFTLTGTTR